MVLSASVKRFGVSCMRDFELYPSLRLLAKLPINFQFSPEFVMICKDTEGGTEMEHHIELGTDQIKGTQCSK